MGREGREGERRGGKKRREGWEGKDNECVVSLV